MYSIFLLEDVLDLTLDLALVFFTSERILLSFTTVVFCDLVFHSLSVCFFFLSQVVGIFNLLFKLLFHLNIHSQEQHILIPSISSRIHHIPE